MTVIGSAEILITPRTSTFAADLDAKTAAGLGGLSTKAEIAGKEAGAKLESGLDGGLAGLGGKADKEGASFAARFSGKISSGLGMLESKVAALGGPFEALAKPIGKVGEGFEETESKGSGLVGTLSSVGKVASVAVVAGLVAGGAAALELGTKMQATDAALAASAGISVAAATKIGDALIQTSEGSIYSGNAVTKAYAGVAGQLTAVEGHSLSAADSQKVMAASMDLAEASGSSLDSTTADVAKVMQAYGLSVGQAASATDVMFSTSRATGVSVDQLTSTVQKLHSQMGAATPPIQQVGGLIADLAQHGETGRQATAALGLAFTGLVSPTVAVTKAQQNLGVNFLNSNGNLVSVSSILTQLQPKLAGMSTAQAEATLQAIGFGNASNKMLSTIEAGPATFDRLTASVSKAGSAHQGAAIQAQTMDHEIAALKVDAEDLFTQLGERLIPVVERVVKTFTDVATVILRDKPLLLGIAAVVGGALLVAIGTFVSTTVAGMTLVDASLAGIPIAIGLVVAAVVYLKDNWKQAWADIRGAFVDAVNFIIKIYNDTIGKMHINIFGHTIGATAITPISAGSSTSVSAATSTSQLSRMTGENVTSTGDKVVAVTKQAADNTTTGVVGVTKAASGPVTAAQIAAAKQAAASAKSAESASTKAAKEAETAAAKEDKARTAAIAKIHALGVADLSKLVAAAHSTSLASLNATLSAANKASLADEERKLLAEHTAAATSLERKLVAAATTAEANRTKLTAAALAQQTTNLQNAEAQALGLQTAAVTDAANFQAKGIADATKVQLDQQAESGLTGADLVAAQAQTALDQLVQQSDIAIAAATQGVDAAAGGTDLQKAQAAAALASVQNSVTIAEATAQSTLDVANAAASAADSAAASASTAAVNSATTSSDSSSSGTSTAGTVVQLTVAPGAVVINPAPGNDSSSLSATQQMVTDAFSALVAELEAGVNNLGTLTVG